MQEILVLDYSKGEKSIFTPEKIFGLKINVLNALRKMKWKVLNKDIDLMIKRGRDLKVIAAAKDILNELKN